MLWWWTVEVAGVTFSDSGSAPVLQFLNPDSAIFQIWESDSCSDSDYSHRSNRNLPMFLLMKWPHRLPLLPKFKSDSGSGVKCGSPLQKKKATTHLWQFRKSTGP